MDYGIAKQEWLEEYGSSIYPAVDTNRLMMMMT